MVAGASITVDVSGVFVKEFSDPEEDGMEDEDEGAEEPGAAVARFSQTGEYVVIVESSSAVR